jgi:hypothetical protein
VLVGLTADGRFDSFLGTHEPINYLKENSMNKDPIFIQELVERVNEWQGLDQPVDDKLLDALIWTFATDEELFNDFKHRVEYQREVYQAEREAIDAEEPACGVQHWPPPGTKCKDCGGTYSSEDAQVVHKIDCPTGGIKAWSEAIENLEPEEWDDLNLSTRWSGASK